MKKLFCSGLIAFLVASISPVLLLPAVAQDAAPSLPAVENLSVKSVGDESVTLTWDELSEANSYVINVGTESAKDTGAYNRAPSAVDKVTEYTIDNLKNDTEYYFSVIGVNEDFTPTLNSISNEVTATPSASESNGTEEAPFILGVDAIDDTSVKIIFSEDMTWPEDPMSNISIIHRHDNSTLGIELVTITDDKTLTIKTETQGDGLEYLLTINEFFLDTDDNPVDDSKRSKVFYGARTTEQVNNADTATEFKVDEIIIVDATALEIVFSRNIKLSDNPVTQFSALRRDDTSDILQIQEIALSELAGNKVLLKTEPQLNVAYTMLISGLEDAEGNLLPEVNTTVNFIGYKSSTQADETPPEDVSDLKLEKLVEDGSEVKLSWTASVNSVGDLDGYKVYTQEEDGDFNLVEKIDKDQLEFTIQGLPTEGAFIFKITAVDNYGNESLGAATNLKNELVIAETGPGNLVFIFMAALLTSYFFKRRNLGAKLS